MSTVRTKFSKHALPALVLSMAASTPACTPYDEFGEAPVAVAGDDQIFAGGSRTITLDGSGSFDPDGEVVRYEWRYTGLPAGYVAIEDEDAGPPDPVLDLLKPLPVFCEDTMQTDEILVPARYCAIVSDSGKQESATIELEEGGYRFTLWVTDDDGKVGADTIEIIVEP